MLPCPARDGFGLSPRGAFWGHAGGSIFLLTINEGSIIVPVVCPALVIPPVDNTALNLGTLTVSDFSMCGYSKGNFALASAFAAKEKQ